MAIAKIVLGDAVSGRSTLAVKRKKVTKTFSDFSTAATGNNIEIFRLPAAAHIMDVFWRTTASFKGTGITSYTLSVGNAATLNKYMLASSASLATSRLAATFKGTALTTAGKTNVESFTAVATIKARAISTGANLSAADAGSVDFYIVYDDVE